MNNKKLQKFSFNFFSIILLVLVIFSTTKVNATELLSDDFTGTTIDTAK